VDGAVPDPVQELPSGEEVEAPDAEESAFHEQSPPDAPRMPDAEYSGMTEGTAPTDEISIGALGVSPRVERLLLENGFVTVGQVTRSLEKDEVELSEIKGFGAKSLEELRSQLRAKGFLADSGVAP
jgi:DNA-directed RNA polymerase alpha subunit